MMLFPHTSAAQKSKPVDKRDFRLSWNRDKVRLYHQEPVVLTIYLWTPEIEVRGVSASKSPVLDKGEFASIQRADVTSRARVVEKDGRRWYVYPIDSYAITMSQSGKYNFRNGRYMVDISVPTLYDDPFWGRIQTMQTQRIELPVQPLEIEVVPLPDTKGSAEFSGAVGVFDVSVTVPPGDIFLNEDALAIITVKGPGWLNEQVLPEYHSAFGNGTKLKSFSEERRQYLENGRLVSEVQMECTFIPTSRKDAKIGKVRLSFFNPETGTYQTVESEEVTVDVKSIADKSQIHSI